jgi:hypothetical protein
VDNDEGESELLSPSSFRTSIRLAREAIETIRVKRPSNPSSRGYPNFTPQ